MFYGQKELIIDEKGRLVLPSNYRDEFVDQKVFLSFGFDNCIELYTSEDYLKKTVEINSLSDFNQQARNVKRTFYSNTFETQLDSHSRILIPKVLLTKADINKNVIMVGLFNHLELWDVDKFNNMQKENEKSFASDAQKLIGEQHE